jgi:predicted transcriptional regulator
MGSGLEGRITLMQISGMPSANRSARPGVTVRLDRAVHERLQQIAKAEHRSVAAVLERLVEREIRARDEAERVIRVHVAPELQGQPFGEPDRRPGESDASHARRKRTIDALFGR